MGMNRHQIVWTDNDHADLYIGGYLSAADLDIDDVETTMALCSANGWPVHITGISDPDLLDSDNEDTESIWDPEPEEPDNYDSDMYYATEAQAAYDDEWVRY